MSDTTDADRTRANETNLMIREIADKIIGNRRLRLAAYLRPAPGSAAMHPDDPALVRIRKV